MEISSPYPQDTSIHPIYAITRLHTHLSVEGYGYPIQSNKRVTKMTQISTKERKTTASATKYIKKKETLVKQRFPFLFSAFIQLLFSLQNQPPKLSYMMLLSSTPRSVSIATTAFDMGPGPHM